jgi:hypothetical protein
MIEGHPEGPEFSAATVLRDLFLTAWPWLESDRDNRVVLVAGVQCHGQVPRDIDIVMLAALPRRPQFQAQFNPDLTVAENAPTAVVRAESLCVAIEVKDHDPRFIRLRGTDVEVEYVRRGGGIEWKSATYQSERQKYSLKNYLDRHVGRSPWVGNLIWLRNILRSDVPRGANNILPAKFTLNGLLNLVAENTRLTRDGDEFVLAATRLGDHLPIQSAVDFLTVRIEPTALDRRRMDRIVKSSVKQCWVDETDNRQLVLRGRGGTGKTILLLQLAWRMHNERGRRTLFLTYNQALLADLRRLITLLGITDDLATPRFQVRTVHSFFQSLLLELGVVTQDENSLSRYEELKERALQYFDAGVVGQDDIEEIRSKDPESFDWDKIFVDEGQDWPRNEMMLLRRLYGTSKLVIADGIDQLIRQERNCDWLEGLQPDDHEVVHLRTGLRMKRNLASFANAIASALGLSGWEVEPLEEATGGKVIIVEGDYFRVSGLHARLKAEAANLGNQPVDMLACVPPSMVLSHGERRTLSIAPHFAGIEQEIWDGTDAGIRSNSYPLSVRQLRVVQYDSCRGLEGWSCLHFDLDVFFEHKQRLWVQHADDMDRAVWDDPSLPRRFAARWLMIPLTRAVDTLVITLGQPNSYLSGLIRVLADGKCKDFVEWISLDGSAN